MNFWPASRDESMFLFRYAFLLLCHTRACCFAGKGTGRYPFKIRRPSGLRIQIKDHDDNNTNVKMKLKLKHVRPRFGRKGTKTNKKDNPNKQKSQEKGNELPQSNEIDCAGIDFEQDPVFLVPVLDEDDTPSLTQIPTTPPTPYTECASMSSSMSDISFNDPDGEEDELLDELLLEEQSNNNNSSPPSITSLDFPDLLIDDGHYCRAKGKPPNQDMIKYRRSKAAEEKLKAVPLETSASAECGEQTTSYHSPNGADEAQDPEATPTTNANKNLHDKIHESLRAIKTFRKKKQRQKQEKEEIGIVSNEREWKLEENSPRASPVTTEPKDEDPKDSETTKMAWEDALKAMEEENKKLESQKTDFAIKRMETQRQQQEEQEILASLDNKPAATNNEWKPRYNDQAIILYSFVARDGMIIADSLSERLGAYECEQVEQFGKDLSDLNPIPGWFQSSFRLDSHKKLRGIKFNIDDCNIEGSPISWDIGCIYDPASDLEPIQIESFIEKIVCISEMFRESEYDWQYGTYLSVQSAFGPILAQRMIEISYMGKRAMLCDRIEKGISRTRSEEKAKQ